MSEDLKILSGFNWTHLKKEAIKVMSQLPSIPLTLGVPMNTRYSGLSIKPCQHIVQVQLRKIQMRNILEHKSMMSTFEKH